MKTTKIFQTRFIDGADGHDTAAEFNEAMRELANLNPRFERDGRSFWIFYSVEMSEPETLTEEHQCQGEHIRCEDCPYFMRDLNRFGNIDARKKWGTCAIKGDRQNKDSVVCDEYYKQPERRRMK